MVLVWQVVAGRPTDEDYSEIAVSSKINAFKLKTLRNSCIQVCYLSYLPYKEILPRKLDNSMDFSRQ